MPWLRWPGELISSTNGLSSRRLCSWSRAGARSRSVHRRGRCMGVRRHGDRWTHLSAGGSKISTSEDACEVSVQPAALFLGKWCGFGKSGDVHQMLPSKAGAKIALSWDSSCRAEKSVKDSKDLRAWSQISIMRSSRTGTSAARTEEKICVAHLA